MQQIDSKILKFLSGLLVILFFLIGYVVQSQQERQNLEVIFLNVGQGDAILIKTPYEQNILIDGGPDNSILSELGQNLSFFDKKLDLVILTHPHSDHVAGLVEVLRRYQVNKVLMTGVVHTAPDYLAFLAEIKKQNIPVDLADAQKNIELGDDLVLKILYPWLDLSGQEVSSLNNTSIIAKLIYKNTSFLFTGDAEDEVEQILLNNNIDLQADVFKVSHHGSKSSNSKNFLAQVNPRYAIIQSGLNNKFGHPHLRTLQVLEKNNIEIFRNDLQGTIFFVSDGNNLQSKSRE